MTQRKRRASVSEPITDGQGRTREEVFEIYFQRAQAYLWSDDFLRTLMNNAPSWVIGADKGVSYHRAVIGSVLTACETSKDYALLLECDFQSLLDAVVRIIRRGLTVADNIAWLVPYRDSSRGGVKIVQDQLGYMGLYQLALRFGMVKSASCQAVYEQDKITIKLGSNPGVDHEPPMSGPRGNFIGVYAIAVMPDGHTEVEWADKAEIDGIRAKAPSRDSPAWVNWYAQQARAKVFKRLLNRAPKPIVFDPGLLRDIDSLLEAPVSAALPAPTERPMSGLDGFVVEQRERAPSYLEDDDENDLPPRQQRREPERDDDYGFPHSRPTQTAGDDAGEDAGEDDPAVELRVPGADKPRLVPRRKAASELVRECGQRSGPEGAEWIRSAIASNPWLRPTPTFNVLQSLLDRAEDDSP